MKPTPESERPPVPPLSAWRWATGFEPDETGTGRDRLRTTWMRSNTERHDFRELVLVLAGGGFYGGHGRLYRLAPGAVILFDRGVPHDRYYSPYQPACRHLWLRIGSARRLMGTELEWRPRAGRGRGGALTTRRHMIIPGAFAECLIASWDACTAGDRNPLAVNRLKAAAAAALLEALAYGDGLERPSHTRAVIEEVLAHVAANLGGDLSLKALAHLSGYEPHYLERLLRRHTGEPLRRHVNRLRLEKARALLGEGLSVSAAAEALGFGSTAYFSRFFTRASGRPPSRWRRAPSGGG